MRGEVVIRKIGRVVNRALARFDMAVTRRSHLEHLSGIASRSATLQEQVKIANEGGERLRSALVTTAETDGYKTAYEPSRPSTKRLMNSVGQILAQEGIQSMPEVSSNIGNLVGLYQGYRQAYLAHAEELGYLRQTAAPIVRKQNATASPVRSAEFLGRIDLWFDQPTQEEKHQRPSIFLVTLPKSATVFI